MSVGSVAESLQQSAMESGNSSAPKQSMLRAASDILDATNAMQKRYFELMQDQESFSLDELTLAATCQCPLEDGSGAPPVPLDRMEVPSLPSLAPSLQSVAEVIASTCSVIGGSSMGKPLPYQVALPYKAKLMETETALHELSVYLREMVMELARVAPHFENPSQKEWIVSTAKKMTAHAETASRTLLGLAMLPPGAVAACSRSCKDPYHKQANKMSSTHLSGVKKLSAKGVAQAHRRMDPGSADPASLVPHLPHNDLWEFAGGEVPVAPLDGNVLAALETVLSRLAGGKAQGGGGRTKGDAGVTEDVASVVHQLHKWASAQALSVQMADSKARNAKEEALVLQQKLLARREGGVSTGLKRTKRDVEELESTLATFMGEVCGDIGMQLGKVRASSDETKAALQAVLPDLLAQMGAVKEGMAQIKETTPSMGGTSMTLNTTTTSRQVASTPARAPVSREEAPSTVKRVTAHSPAPAKQSRRDALQKDVPAAPTASDLDSVLLRKNTPPSNAKRDKSKSRPVWNDSTDVPQPELTKEDIFARKRAEKLAEKEKLREQEKEAKLSEKTVKRASSKAPIRPPFDNSSDLPSKPSSSHISVEPPTSRGSEQDRPRRGSLRGPASVQPTVLPAPSSAVRPPSPAMSESADGRAKRAPSTRRGKVETSSGMSTMMEQFNNPVVLSRPSSARRDSNASAGVRPMSNDQLPPLNSARLPVGSREAKNYVPDVSSAKRGLGMVEMTGSKNLFDNGARRSSGTGMFSKNGGELLNTSSELVMMDGYFSSPER